MHSQNFRRPEGKNGCFDSSDGLWSKPAVCNVSEQILAPDSWQRFQSFALQVNNRLRSRDMVALNMRGSPGIEHELATYFDYNFAF